MHPVRRFSILWRPVSALRRLGRRLRRDRRGNYSMIVAILLPVITGFVALGTELGLWLYDQQIEQTAADNAAFSAAVYYAGQGSNATTATLTSAQIQAAAVAANYGFGGSVTSTTTCAVTFHGVTAAACSTSSGGASCSVTTPGTGTSCVQINYPPAGGPNAGVANCPPTSPSNPCFIEVMVAQQPQQLFSAVLLSNPVTIEARAVGEVAFASGSSPIASNACVLVTDTSSDTGAATIANNANISAANCDLAVNDPNTGGLTASGNGKATFKGIFDDAPSIASGSITSNAAVNGPTTFNVTTANPYNITGLPSVSSASSGPCGFTAIMTGTFSSAKNTITGLSSTSGISVGMFAVSPGFLSATSPNQNVVTTVNSSTEVTLATNATSTGSNELVQFGVNAGAMAITANTTLQPGYYTGINALNSALVNLTPGIYYICPIPVTTTASGTTTTGASSTTVVLPSSGPPTGWVNGMVISDADAAIPANTIISNITIFGTLSKDAKTKETGDTFSSTGGSGTATGNITTTTATVECDHLHVESDAMDERYDNRYGRRACVEHDRHRQHRHHTQHRRDQSRDRRHAHGLGRGRVQRHRQRRFLHRALRQLVGHGRFAVGVRHQSLYQRHRLLQLDRHAARRRHHRAPRLDRVEQRQRADRLRLLRAQQRRQRLARAARHVGQSRRIERHRHHQHAELQPGRGRRHVRRPVRPAGAGPSAKLVTAA